jgi:hypothetical protein
MTNKADNALSDTLRTYITSTAGQGDEIEGLRNTLKIIQHEGQNPSSWLAEQALQLHPPQPDKYKEAT